MRGKLVKLWDRPQERGEGWPGSPARRWWMGALGVAWLVEPALAGWQAVDGEVVSSARSASARLLILFVVVVGVLLFVAVAFVYLRSSRRYRRWLLRRRPEPTPSDDIWSKSKVPDDHDDTGLE